MSWHARLVTALGAVALLATLVPAASAAPSPPAADRGAAAVPGRVLVTWEPGATAADRERVRRGHGLATEDMVEGLGIEALRIPAHTPAHVAERLAGEAAVAIAEPDHLLTAASVDPYFDRLWGLHNTGQDGGVADVDVDAPEAWQYTTGTSEVIVAVVDTGVDISHPDLVDNIWTNPDEVADGNDTDGNGLVDDLHGWDFLNDDATVYDDASEDFHGTHVAGTIAAAADNDVGVAGVAPNVTLMPLKFLGSAEGEGSTLDAVAAIDYAVTNGADVINASWGGGGGDTLKHAIARASDTAFVVAAGNDGNDVDAPDIEPYYPAGWAHDDHGIGNVLSVTAVDRTGARPSFANHGVETVDVAGPGAAILSTAPGERYGTTGGTSMATPHAAGVAALAASLSPGLDGTQLVDAVKAGAQPLDALDGVTTTGGLVNAAATLRLHRAPTAPTDVTATAGDQTATVGWTPPTGDGAPTSYEVTVAPPDDVTGTTSRTASAPTTTLDFDGLANGTAYTFTVTATNGAGASASSDPSAPVTPTAPEPEPTTEPELTTEAGPTPQPEPTTAPEPTSEPGTAADEVEAGGTLSTDTTGTGATEDVPVQTSVTVSSAGTVAISFGPATTTPPTDWSYLDAEVAVTAPTASTSDPLALAFHLDGTLGADGVVVFRNGTPVAECPGSPVASPDPCVSDRSRSGDDTVLTVLTSRASDWNFGRPTTACPSARVPASGFSDLGGGVHDDAIECMTWWEVANGVSADRFDPGGQVTRGQMASFVARAIRNAGGPLPAGIDRFVDDDGSVHADDIDALAAAGIVNGIDAERYAPGRAVSRAEMAAFLVRADTHLLGIELVGTSDPFVDDDASVHEPAINAAYDAGLTRGTGGDSYSPMRAVVRAEMATFLSRLLDRWVSQGAARTPA